jgi:glycosyltransferase involved in cell wall biosynthesis
MPNSTYLSVVMPVLNEEQALRSILPQLKRFLSQKPYDAEIIICDNGSTDNSIAVAQEYDVTIIIEKQRGYGHAVKKLLSSAQGDVVITLDADNTYPIAAIDDLVKEVEEKQLGLVIGNRFSTQQYIRLRTMPFINRIGNALLTFFVRVLFGITVRDSQTGMVAVHRNVVSNILVDGYNQFSFPQTMKILLIKKYGVAFSEIGINYDNRIGKKKLNSLIDGTKNLLSLIYLRLTL